MVVTASNPPAELLRVADTALAGMDYLWALALDAPDTISSTVRRCTAQKSTHLLGRRHLVTASLQRLPFQNENKKHVMILRRWGRLE